MKYTYAYKESNGKRHEGAMDAPSREAVFAALREKGIKAIKVVAADGSKANGEEKTPWWKSQIINIIISSFLACAFAYFFDLLKPIDPRVQAEVDHLHAETDFLSRMREKDSAQIESLKSTTKALDSINLVAQKIVGNADSQTVERVKQEVIEFLSVGVLKNYVTHNELEQEKNELTATVSIPGLKGNFANLLFLASRARGGDRIAYDELGRLMSTTNELAQFAAASVREVDQIYKRKSMSIVKYEIVTDLKGKTPPLDDILRDLRFKGLAVGAINSLSDLNDKKIVGKLVCVVDRSPSLDEVFAAIVGLNKLIKKDFSPLGIAEVRMWWKDNSSNPEYLLPADQVANLYTEIAKRGGTIVPHSESAWELMNGMYDVIKENKNHNCDRVAVELLQIGLRHGFVGDEVKRQKLKEWLGVALDRYGQKDKKPNDWYVLKAVYLFIYETNNFTSFVSNRIAEHPKFEDEMRQSRFMKDSLFTSPFWPRSKGK